MPDKAQQFFLVTVARMCTSPEADLVAQLSYVVAEEDLVKPGNELLALSVEATELTLRGVPVEGMRPMTEAEIATYRHKDEADAG